MKKSLICIIFAFAVLFSSACGNEESNYLDYQNGNCEIDTVFMLDEKEYAAHISLSALTEEEKAGGLICRDMKISFSEPESLRGITVTKAKSGSGISFGEVNIPLSEDMLAGIINVCSVFCIENAALDNISPKKENSINILKISSEKGKYTVYLDTQKKTPVQIYAELGGRIIDMQITAFDKNAEIDNK